MQADRLEISQISALGKLREKNSYCISLSGPQPSGEELRWPVAVPAHLHQGENMDLHLSLPKLPSKTEHKRDLLNLQDRTWDYSLFKNTGPSLWNLQIACQGVVSWTTCPKCMQHTISPNRDFFYLAAYLLSSTHTLKKQCTLWRWAPLQIGQC